MKTLFASWLLLLLSWRCEGFSLRRSRSASLSMSSVQDEVVLVPYAESALQSSSMAKQVRILRRRRGRRLPDRQHKEQQKCRPATGTTKPKTSVTPSREPTLGYSYNSTLQVLRAYHTVHGDLVLPRRFVVPAASDYPTEWHGVDLASNVYKMRWWQLNVQKHPNRVAQLNKLGFCWERLQPEWNLILEALITYSSLHGHLIVPVSFVVPHGNIEWPKATWGIALGKCVFRMRTRNDFLRGSKGATRRSQLDGLGFCWDVGEYVFQKFCAALAHYKKLQTPEEFVTTLEEKNALKIPSSFAVPMNDPAWPQGLWGYPLGAKCVAVRQKGLYVKGNPARQEKLRELGFSFRGNASRGWLQVVHAAAIYSQLHDRKLSVPQSYVVPAPPQQDFPGFHVGSSDAWPWPSHLWGFPLGQRLKDVRLKRAYLKGREAPQREAQLNALGFDWNPKKGRRSKQTL